MGKLLENISLQKFNTFGVDVKSRYFFSFESSGELAAFSNEWNLVKKSFLILGEGSNVLFTGDFDGLTIHPAIKGRELVEENEDYVKIKAGCGENWDQFVEFCVGKNLGGVENLSLIPGSVGASPIQNIGAYGVEVKDVIENVEAFSIENRETRIFSNKECHFGYRDSIFKRELKNKVIVTGVTFRLTKKHRLITHYGTIEKELINFKEKNLMNIRSVIIKIRKDKLPDPAEIGNAGSFFKNPLISLKTYNILKAEYPAIPGWEVNEEEVKLSAAWLIEQCNLKRSVKGDVGTYSKQPLVIVNYGGATGKEILDFSKEIQKAVKNKFKVDLQTEVNVY